MSDQIVLILGDVHLGKGTNIGKVGIGSNLNSQIADQLNLLDWVLDKAVDNDIDNIIITGDIFEDPSPHYSLVSLFVSWLRKCQLNNINIHIVLGNHDILRYGSIQTSPLDIISEMDSEGIFIYKQISTTIINTTAFTFIPFCDRKFFNCSKNSEALSILKDNLSYELSSIPVTYNKIAIGHLAIEKSIPIGDEINDMTNELFCPIDMFEGYDRVWMGHIHNPQVMSENPFVSHIGSMDLSNFGESNQKKHVIILNCDTNEYTAEYLPIRPLKKITISIPKEIDDTTEYVLSIIRNENVDRAIVRVEIVLESIDAKPVNKMIVEQELMLRKAFNVAGIFQSRKSNQVKRDEDRIIHTNMNVISAIHTYADAYVDANIRDSFIELANEIYVNYF